MRHEKKNNLKNIEHIRTERHNKNEIDNFGFTKRV
jgi:hypothetical protein